MAEVSYLLTGGLGNFTTGIGGGGLTAGEVANAVWDAVASSHLVAGTTGAVLSSRTSQSSVDAVDDEMENLTVGLTSLESDIAEVKEKTDQLTFTIPGSVDATAGLVVDGMPLVDMLEAVLAVLTGVAVPSGNTVSFKKRDGTSEKVLIFYGPGRGERIASGIT